MIHYNEAIVYDPMGSQTVAFLFVDDCCDSLYNERKTVNEQKKELEGELL